MQHTVYGKYFYWFYEVNTLLMDNNLYFLQDVLQAVLKRAEKPCLSAV